MVNFGKFVEDNGNWFIGYVVFVEFFKQVRKFIVEVMCINIILSVSYNIYVYRVINLDGFIYEGFDDDGEFGVG